MRLLIERTSYYYTIDAPKIENYYSEPPPAFENLNNESSSDTVNTGENENYNDKRSQKIINRYLEDEAYKSND